MGGKGSGVTAERERLHRVNELWKYIIREKSVEGGLAIFQFKYGIARRTALDYVKVLKANNKIQKQWEK